LKLPSANYLKHNFDEKSYGLLEQLVKDVDLDQSLYNPKAQISDWAGEQDFVYDEEAQISQTAVWLMAIVYMKQGN